MSFETVCASESMNEGEIKKNHLLAFSVSFKNEIQYELQYSKTNFFSTFSRKLHNLSYIITTKT